MLSFSVVQLVQGILCYFYYCVGSFLMLYFHWICSRVVRTELYLIAFDYIFLPAGRFNQMFILFSKLFFILIWHFICLPTCVHVCTSVYITIERISALSIQSTIYRKNEAVRVNNVIFFFSNYYYSCKAGIWKHFGIGFCLWFDFLEFMCDLNNTSLSYSYLSIRVRHYIYAVWDAFDVLVLWLWK